MIEVTASKEWVKIKPKVATDRQRVNGSIYAILSFDFLSIQWCHFIIRPDFFYKLIYEIFFRFRVGGRGGGVGEG